MKIAAVGLVVSLIVVAVPAASMVSKEPARVIRVISADTLTILYRGNWEEIKLIGPEAPQTALNDKAYEEALRDSATPEEILQRGLKATEFVKGLLRYGSQVWIEFDALKRDRYSRLLGYVYLADGRMLNEVILRQGLARLFLVPPNLRYSQRFQELARLAKRGIQPPGR
jgi:micrococcal nuclease